MAATKASIPRKSLARDIFDYFKIKISIVLAIVLIQIIALDKAAKTAKKVTKKQKTGLGKQLSTNMQYFLLLCSFYALLFALFQVFI